MIVQILARKPIRGDDSHPSGLPWMGHIDIYLYIFIESGQTVLRRCCLLLLPLLATNFSRNVLRDVLNYILLSAYTDDHCPVV